MSQPPVNILLIDDRPDGLLTLEAVLKCPEYCLVKASSGTEALEKLKAYEFAIILLDVQMPGMDGFETAQRIKRDERGRITPIVFITAINKDNEHVQKGYEAGAVDYLFKPFHPEILRSKVASFVDLYRLQIKTREQSQLLEKNHRNLKWLYESLKKAQRDIVEISEKERCRLGQDLHDGLAQELTAVCFMIQSSKTRWGKDIPENVQKVFDDALQFLKNALTNCRMLARNSYPVELERQGLSMAMQELVHNTAKVYQIDCRFILEGPEPLEDNMFIKTQLYRIAQEAIQNATRHAKAKKITVLIKNFDRELQLSIEDDGIGIEKKHRVQGMGFRIMNHRAQMVGAVLSVESVFQKGTTVHCCYVRPESQLHIQPFLTDSSALTPGFKPEISSFQLAKPVGNGT